MSVRAISKHTQFYINNSTDAATRRSNTFYNKLMIVEAALITHPFDADVEFAWFATVNLLQVTDFDNSE
ncbi:hypothetical protein A4A49_38555 [Nicotiana attenuata]|uniref:Uncharacterized protein n=1 Tax=Nicotiana attenuata TaxID=49451 RepID=A0A1J6JSA3_NICAT|nr:hypothetical protein A4A49_38555 [Nicotiana attenuata]